MWFTATIPAKRVNGFLIRFCPAKNHDNPSAAGRKIPPAVLGESSISWKREDRKYPQRGCYFVQNFVKLTEEEINRVFSENESKLSLTPKQRERWHNKCICLIEFAGVEKIDPPLAFEKQSNMDDWLIIEKIEDVLAGTSIPYNYDKSKL